MKRILITVLIVILLASVLPAQNTFSWNELPELPPLPGKVSQPGLSGAFAGVHNDALIVAGGANVPEILQQSWQEGERPVKIYNSEIYLLQKNKPWIISNVKLPKGFSYGVSIPTDKGLICIGGEWSEYNKDGYHKFISDKVFLIKHLGEGKIAVEYSGFPELPEALSSMAGAKIGDYIYIAGGNNGRTETKTFLRLDLKKMDKWEKLDPWPGLPRSNHILAAQSDGIKNCLFLIGGGRYDPGGNLLFLTDGYKYEPDNGTWIKLAKVGTNLKKNKYISVMGTPGIKVGANHIAVFGRDIYVYHTITDTWTKLEDVPELEITGLTAGSFTFTNAVQWDKDIVIPGGEVSPVTMSPKILVATPKIKSGFGVLNYIVLGVYLGSLILMGFYFSKRENSTDDFFKAGGRIPWWAAGLSIFGTQLSAITFMAIPAKSFATDWTWFVMNMTIIMVAPLIVFLFLPFYRRLNVTTAYEYIEKRFNVVVRVMASAMFMVFQFARIGIVLFLPSIALSLVTGIDIRICIAVMGLLSIAYTVMGGIEAVIWTDVIQVFVLLGGALLVLFLIPAQVQGGFSGMMELADDADKLRLFDFHFSFNSPTLWVLVLGGIGANLISYGSDQTVIQRYLTTKDEKDAARGIWTSAILTVPASIIFFGLGTALFAFFKSNPEALSATMENADAIFPWFIVTQLPAGIAGLLIAGVFAAAMSSLDSSMNSVAAAFTTDFYRRFKPSVEDVKCLKVARIVTVVIGLCGMVFALMMATWDIKSLWSEFTKYIGLFGGGLGGLFILAIFTRRANARGAITGLIASAVIQYFLSANAVVHGVLFSATGMITCVVIGYLASLLMPEKEKDLEGLTLYSLKKVDLS